MNQDLFKALKCLELDKGQVDYCMKVYKDFGFKTLYAHLGSSYQEKFVDILEDIICSKNSKIEQLTQR